MEPSGIAYTPWEFKSLSVSKLEDDKIWPALGSENSNHSEQRCIVNQESNSKGDNDIKANLNYIEYPKLGEKMKKIRSTNANVLNIHTNIFLGSRNSGEGSKYKSSKSYRRTDKIYINLQEIIESAITTAKIHCKNSTKPNIQIIETTNSTNSTPVKKEQETSLDNRKKLKVNPRILKGGRLTKLRRMIPTYRGKRDSCVSQRRQCRAAQTLETITDSANNLNLDALNFSSCPDNTDYTKRFASLSFYDKDYRNPEESSSNDHRNLQPDLISTLNNLNIYQGEEKNRLKGHYLNLFDAYQNVIEEEVIQRTRSLGINDNDETDISDSIVDAKVQFSKNFREYCTNMLTVSLNKYLEKFLSEVVRLQRKLYDRDSNKARYKRRYYAGLKEVRKHVELKKIKFVVIAPDLEKVQLEGGLDDRLYKLLAACEKAGVIVCFGLRRRKLRRYTYGKGFTACIGVSNYGGVEEMFKNVLLELVKARNEFRIRKNEPEKIISLTNVISENDLLSDSINALKNVLSSN